jgi:phage antirepressor YoqD-like protein
MTINNTYAIAARNQAASAVIMANGSPFARQLRKASPNYSGNTIPSTLTEALQLARMLEKERLKLEHEVKVLKQQYADFNEMAAFYEEVAETEHLFDIDEAAKLVGTGRTRLLEYLRKHRVLMRSTHRMNRPYQEYLDAGQFEVKHLPYRNRNTGELKLKTMPFLTGKGLIWLQQFISKHGRTGL